MKILVVDDSRTMTEWTRDVLKDAGHEVQISQSTDIGAVTKAFQPEMVLMDVMMLGDHDLVGALAARAYKKSDPSSRTTFLLYSSKSEEEMKALCAAAEVDGYVCKTDDPWTLLSRLQPYFR